MKPPPAGSFSKWYAKMADAGRTEQAFLRDIVEENDTDWADIMRWLDDNPSVARVLCLKVYISEQVQIMFGAWLRRQDSKHEGGTPACFTKRTKDRPFWESLDRNRDFWKALSTWDEPPRECDICCAALTSRNVHVMDCGHSSTCRECGLKLPRLPQQTDDYIYDYSSQVKCPICRAPTMAPVVMSQSTKDDRSFLGSWENAAECVHREGLLNSIARSIGWTCRKAIDAVREQRAKERSWSEFVDDYSKR